MLSSLKEKILNVSIFTITEGQQTKIPVNVNAGGEILAHYQKNWEELHKINEENACKADLVAEDIKKVVDYVSDNKKNLALINHLITNSNLNSNINKCLESIDNLYKSSEQIEKDLIQLEDLIDQIDFERIKKRHSYHLEEYEKRKEAAFVNFKSEMEEKHLKKVEEYEKSKKDLMKERQQVFQDAFKYDLEMYKHLGTVPAKVNQNQNGALLEEIQLDYDPKELDKFFSDGNV